MARRKRRPRGRSGCTSRTTRGLVSGRAGHHRWSTQCRRRRCDLERERSDLKTIWLGSIALLRQLELDWTAIGERSVQKGRLSHACLHE
jgi:hypothetical protein